MKRTAAAVLLLALVAPTGCAPDHAAPPDAECPVDRIGKLLSNYSLSFSAGFGPSQAWLAADKIRDIKPGGGRVFVYEDVTFGKHQLGRFDFYAHRRKGGVVIIWIRCYDSPAAARELEAELSRVADQLRRRDAPETSK